MNQYGFSSFCRDLVLKKINAGASHDPIIPTVATKPKLHHSHRWPPSSQITIMSVVTAVYQLAMQTTSFPPLPCQDLQNLI